MHASGAEPKCLHQGLRRDSRWHAQSFCPLEGVSIRFIADHEGGVYVLVVRKILDQVLTVRAASRHEYGNISFLHYGCKGSVKNRLSEEKSKIFEFFRATQSKGARQPYPLPVPSLCKL